MNVKPACEARSLNLSGGTEPAGPCPVLVRWSVDAESARRCNSIKAKAKRRHTAVRFLIVTIDLRQSSRRGVRTVREYQYDVDCRNRGATSAKKNDIEHRK